MLGRRPDGRTPARPAPFGASRRAGSHLDAHGAGRYAARPGGRRPLDLGGTDVRPIPRRGVALVIAILAAVVPAATVVAVDSPPPTLATADTYSATEDQVLTVAAPGLLANDNPELTSCVASVDSAGLAGTVEFLPDGSFSYTPAANFNGATSFTYGMRVTGDASCSEPADSQAAVTITVAAVNDPPTAANDTFMVLAGRTLTVHAPGILMNDNDVDGDPLTASLVTGVSHGTLVLASNGSFAYTPPSGFLGPDGFSYRASDGSATSPTRVVTLSVVAIPTPIPTLAPTPTAIPTIEPTVEPSPEPTPAESTAAETTVTATPSPAATLAPSTPASLVPGATLVPAPAAVAGGGPSLPALLVIILFAVLVAFGAALYVPRWLNAARTGEPPDDD